MLVKTDVQGYVKDTASGLIINNNVGDYEKAFKAREEAKKNNALIKRVSNLEIEVRELKITLQKLQKEQKE